jgi:small subunit ribosomal protein S4
MARYRGPQTKISRKFGESIFGYDKAFEKRNYPPGQHGLSSKRKQKSEYAIQLREKQKAKYTYGVLERQFANLFDKAARKKGITGENLLKYLEARLDNTLFRMGVASSRRQGRQMVVHKHIMVNDHIVNIPSYILKPGDKISVREKSKEMDAMISSLTRKGQSFPWVEFNRERMEGTFLAMPERDQIPENINEQLIVELYSK